MREKQSHPALSSSTSCPSNTMNKHLRTLECTRKLVKGIVDVGDGVSCGSKRIVEVLDIQVKQVDKQPSQREHHFEVGTDFALWIEEEGLSRGGAISKPISNGRTYCRDLSSRFIKRSQPGVGMVILQYSMRINQDQCICRHTACYINKLFSLRTTIASPH